MSNVVTFYFDFVSPYSYLAQKRLGQVLEETGAQVQYVPVFLGGLHQAQDVKSPPMVPAKAKWIVRDCHMWAQQFSITLKWPAQFPFNTLFLLRLCVWLQQTQPEKVNEFVDQTFKAVWEQGLDCHNQADVSSYLHRLGFDGAQVMAGVSDSDVKKGLIENGELAVKKDMFGLPVFEVDNKLYFGQDRLHFVTKALAGHPLNDGSDLTS